MKYKYLLFDADNTLLDFSKAEHDGLTKAFCELGIPLNDKLRNTYVELNKKLWQKHEKGEIDRETLLNTRFDILFSNEGIKADGVKAENVYRKYLDEGCYIISGADILLKELSKSCEIYIVTNGTAKTQQKRLKESGLLQYIDNAFISEQIGFNKPSKQFFDYVIQNISGFTRKRALVIGDSLSSDIFGGINSGIDTCWYNPCGLTGNIKPTYEIKRLEEIKNII